MVVRVGMIGISEGNGHPFSFSAIINGYSDDGLANAGWPVIHDYVRARHFSDFGVGELKVTHAWTQDAAQSRLLCAAADIPHSVSAPTDIIGSVDAVIIARDDYARHMELAEPFLNAGLPVFVDKPLCLDAEELARFAPYLERGQLMSCSGMRFAKELDELRRDLPGYGRLSLVRAAVVNDWTRYGIHMLDAIFPLLEARPAFVRPLPGPHDSVAIHLNDGPQITIDALGRAPKTFRIDVFGTDRTSSHEIADNFSMFRRCLWEFWTMIDQGRPSVPAASTIDIIRTLIAGQRAIREQKDIAIDDIRIS